MSLSMQVLDRAYFLPRTGSGDETRVQYQGLCQALEEYMRKTFYDWTLTVDKVGNHDNCYNKIIHYSHHNLQ